MIICNKISKSYGNRQLFKNFSYVFNDLGFYFLNGRSGSGKTTLLNLLCGLTSFEHGEITFTNINKSYKKNVNNEEVMNEIAYISQNTYLIDYLDVIDNLKLCSKDDERIIELMKEFKLEYILKSYPNQLSGGEKQRVAIIQALLKGKRIFLLDEPTASLDKENKIMFFELLSKLKTKVLIIVSSHDSIINDYADEVIYFKELPKYSIDVNIAAIKATNCDNNNATLNSQNLVKYMVKNFKYSTYEKRSSILLFIVFLIAMLICFICDTPINKLMSNIDKVYKVNQFRMYCNKDTNNFCQEVINDPLVRDVVFDYAMNLPKLELKDGAVIDLPYNATAVTLPFFKDDFKLSKKIIYGNYFKEKNDIIVSYDYARNLVGNGRMDDLIGKKIKEPMLNGIEEFKISGIFSKFEDNDYLYFNGQSTYKEQLDNNFFVNSKFTHEYFESDVSNDENNQIAYNIYFENFSDMNKVYQQNYKSDKNFIVPYESSFYNLINSFNSLSIVLYPVGLISLFISILFYFQLAMIKLEYTKYNYCVYNQYGYSLKDIMKSYTKSIVIHMCILLSISLISSLVLGNVLNILNDTFNIVPFTIFTFNFSLILLFIISIIVVTLVISIKLSRKIKKMGWYNMLQESRDLL